MALPVQVQRQVDRVAELQKEMGGNPPTPALVVTDPATPPAPPPPPSAPVTPKTYTEEEFNALNQRYSTLQGMFNAETKRLRDALTDTTRTLDALKSEVETLKAKPAAVTTQQKLVTEEDEREYGTTLELMRRAAKDEAAALYQPVIDTLNARLAKLEGTTTKVEDIAKEQQQTRVNGFWTTLEAAVPDWKAINDNPKFKDWLLAVDDLSGTTRQQFLANAQQALDAERVIKFFREWTKSQEAPTPSPTPKPQTSELERQIAPSGGRSVVPPTPEAEPAFTRADITQFYADVTAGKYRSRPEEKAKLENQIFAAQKAGRIK